MSAERRSSQACGVPPSNSKGAYLDIRLCTYTPRENLSSKAPSLLGPVTVLILETCPVEKARAESKPEPYAALQTSPLVTGRSR